MISLVNTCLTALTSWLISRSFSNRDLGKNRQQTLPILNKRRIQPPGRILRFYFPPGSQTRSSLPGGDHQSLTFLLHRRTQFHLLSPNRTRGNQSPKTNCRRFLPAIAPAPQTRTLPIVLCRQTLHDIEIPIEHTETNHRLLPLPVDNEFQPARSQSIIEIIGHEYHPDFRRT